jgi:hypothetical protein
MMQWRVLPFLVMGALSAMTPGCKLMGGGTTEAEAAPSPPPAGPVYQRYPLGEITFLNANEAFVLIKADGASNLPEGSLLESRNAMTGQVASLELSPERKRSFLVADIKSGQVAVGDRVNLLIEVKDGGGY